MKPIGFSILPAIFVLDAALAQGEVSIALAGQVRSQGNACEDPATARRDIELSNADETVWNLKCKTASYRMYLKPNTPARVERID